MVDLSFLKRELEKVSNATSNQDVKWKPPVGKSVIHFLPYKFDDSYPFRKLRFHYSLNPSVYCLENDDEGSCPVCKKASELWKQGQDDVDARNLAKKLFAKDRYYTPIFVRSENGNEVNEMRIWGFGKQLYKKILDLYEEHETDLTDVKNAPDFIIKFTEPAPGETFGDTDIMVDPKTIKVAKPVAASKGEISQIVESVPEIESLFIHRPAAEVIDIFAKYINSLDKPSTENVNKNKVEKMKRESIAEDKSKDSDDDFDKKFDSMFDDE